MVYPAGQNQSNGYRDVTPRDETSACQSFLVHGSLPYQYDIGHNWCLPQAASGLALPPITVPLKETGSIRGIIDGSIVSVSLGVGHFSGCARSGLKDSMIRGKD